MRRLLIVVDYQNDFIDGALGFEGADQLVTPIVNLIKAFKENNEAVVYTLDTHEEDYMKTVEGSNLPVPHCLKGSDGWDFRHEIKELVNDDLVFEKPGFGSKDLGEYIEDNQFDEIYLCGLVSDICVFSNAIIAKAFASPYTKIKVVEDATSSFDLDMQKKSFDVLKHLHIEIIRSNEIFK